MCLLCFPSCRALSPALLPNTSNAAWHSTAPVGASCMGTEQQGTKQETGWKPRRNKKAAVSLPTAVNSNQSSLVAMDFLGAREPERCASCLPSRTAFYLSPSKRAPSLAALGAAVLPSFFLSIMGQGSSWSLCFPTAGGCSVPWLQGTAERIHQDLGASLGKPISAFPAVLRVAWQWFQ